MAAMTSEPPVLPPDASPSPMLVPISTPPTTVAMNFWSASRWADWAVSWMSVAKAVNSTTA